PLTGVAPTQTVYLERRAGPLALQGREASLSPQLGHTNLLAIHIVIPREGSDGGARGRACLAHRIVEALNRDRAVGAVQRGKDLGKGVQGVLHRTTVSPRMEVLGWAVDLEVQRGHAPAANGDRREVGSPHGPVGAQRKVG